MSIDNKIEASISKAKEGSIFFAVDFRELGSMTAIYTTLHRIAKRGVLRRMAQGIYAKPYISKLLNQEILPGLDEVAHAIAKRDGSKLIPTGSFALNILGLSNQVPLNAVYYTDGKTRKLKIGNRTIQFIKTSPKNVALKGKTSKLVVQALREIGKGKITSDEEEKILALLKKENLQDLKHDLRLVPQWVAEIMAKALT